MVERYAHLAPDQLPAAAARLDAVLPGYVLAMDIELDSGSQITS